MFANMTLSHREQLSTDVDNNKIYFTKEKEHSKVFGKCKREGCKKELSVWPVCPPLYLRIIRTVAILRQDRQLNQIA